MFCNVISHDITKYYQISSLFVVNVVAVVVECRGDADAKYRLRIIEVMIACAFRFGLTLRWKLISGTYKYGDADSCN